MSRRLSRRTLLAGGALLPLAGAARSAMAQGHVGATGSEIHPEFPRQHPDRVADVVGAAHRDLERVRALVEETPALANADWDWGFGDWETPLGAAAHTGQRAIAEYLLARGARATIFSAAMLGQLAVVRAFVEADPGVRRTTGPHGIPLLEHARAGGPGAAEVLRYLESLGDAAAPPPAPPSAEQRAAYLGRYVYGSSPGRALEVGERGDRVTIRSGEASPRFLVPAGSHAFHPVGAPAVRIVFAVPAAGAAATRVSVHDGPLVLTATRETAAASGPAPSS